MQTIEEYKAYTRQLEGEVGKWHHAYDALMVERNQLVKNVLNLESGSRNMNETIEAMAAELYELRKHEVEWDMAKARIKELESQLKQNQGEKQDENTIP